MLARWGPIAAAIRLNTEVQIYLCASRQTGRCQEWCPTLRHTTSVNILLSTSLWSYQCWSLFRVHDGNVDIADNARLCCNHGALPTGSTRANRSAISIKPRADRRSFWTSLVTMLGKIQRLMCCTVSNFLKATAPNTCDPRWPGRCHHVIGWELLVGTYTTGVMPHKPTSPRQVLPALPGLIGGFSVQLCLSCPMVWKQAASCNILGLFWGCLPKVVGRSGSWCSQFGESGC